MMINLIKKYGNVGLGGEGVLRTHSLNSKARDVILAAIDNGISYFDSARVYSDSELYYGSVWSELPEIQVRIFQTSKSTSREKSILLQAFKPYAQRFAYYHGMI